MMKRRKVRRERVDGLRGNAGKEAGISGNRRDTRGRDAMEIDRVSSSLELVLLGL
jgi:hypothetical protein